MKKILLFLLAIFGLLLTSCGKNSEMNGKYELSHIVVKEIKSGNERTYQLGDRYFGITLSCDTLKGSLKDGKGNVSYNYKELVSTDLTYEVEEQKLIITCENEIDLYGNGNYQSVYELLIEEIDGHTYLVLRSTNNVYDFTYYIIKA